MQQPAQSLDDTDSSCLCPDVARLQLEVENLQRALVTRQLIGIAQGVIMAREGCPPDKAFEILSRASQRQNRKVVELAQQIVDRNSAEARTQAMS